MKNWFLEQGFPLYVEAVLLAAGLFALWMTNRSYKRLIREADSMGTSEHRLMKYIKVKVTSYFKIGMHPENMQALIERYIKKHRIGLFSLYGWSRFPYLIMTVLLSIGGGSFMYRWMNGEEISQASALFGFSILGTWIIFGIMRFVDFDGKEEILIDHISDYTSNYLNNKLAFEYKDQAGNIPPEQYKKVLQEIAASGINRRKERKPKYYFPEYEQEEVHNRNNDVDAKVVEDVLKEFLY